MESTARVIDIQESKAVTLFDLSESVFQEIETYQGLEIVDSKTETDVRQARAAVREVRYKIQRRHKELNSDLNKKKKDYKTMAESLIERLLPTENDLDGKIKAVEEESDRIKAEKMAVEKARTDAILSEITHIEDIAAAAQTYGLSSGEIQKHIDILESLPIDESRFEEFTENAISLKTKSLESMRACLDRTLKFEADQKAQAELEAKNKAEAERLARIAEEQEKARKEAEAEKARAEAEAQAKREAEAAKLAQKKAQIEAEKAAIQAEKDRMAAEAEKAAFAERVMWCESVGAEWYVADWDEAHAINDEINRQAQAEAEAFAKRIEWCESVGVVWYAADWDEAHKTNADIDIDRAAMAEALKPDKEKLIELVKVIQAIKMPELKTSQAHSVARWAINQLDCTARDLDGMIGGL